MIDEDLALIELEPNMKPNSCACFKISKQQVKRAFYPTGSGPKVTSPPTSSG